MKDDEEYLDEKFPKGKSKLRGEAMVLLALARKVGREEVIERNNLTEEELEAEE